ncbi:hypothetical protein [Tenacibaculum aquimarinum]|uniref:hypothetical protein n=1 Tax=Tenacibaculum aquimarinum TaxID=2910675 RepID=UPI001F0ABCEB|nr:hypothetical protein [Tenacibaculum aquimarinum]MCH3884398.1 hypothetical protein [Tenacibaculum aquimarinum]
MKLKYDFLVQKTKLELARLDKLPSLNWEQQKKYNNEFLPISVEPKIRKRALDLMNNLVNLLHENGHSIKFNYSRCQIEIYGQLTEFHLRQKYFRVRVKNSYGTTHNTFEKSNKLEFLIGSSYCKTWIDKKTKSLEDYLPTIYKHIEAKSKYLAEIRKKQALGKIEREKNEAIRIEKGRIEVLEEERFLSL